MKRTKIRTRIAATVLAAITVFTVITAATASASAAVTGQVIPDAGYAAGIGIIRQYVPYGQSIVGVIDTVVGSYKDKGPSLAEISADIKAMRSEISEGFAEIKDQMKDYTEAIENKIVDQTVISEKGAGFDKLMTALQGTARQINTINDDESLNDNEKAVEIASLIGKNSEWIKSNNLYFEYQDFMNTLSSSSFADQKDRDLYQVVYNDFTSDVMFSGEALDMSRPYIDRVMLLGLYAYSINAQCLKAAQTVSQFTEEEVATLNADEQSNYRNVKSLTSLVNAEITDMHDKMFDTDRADSVVSHLYSYVSMDRLVYINRNNSCKAFAGALSSGSLANVGDDDYFRNVIYPTINEGALSKDGIIKLASYVKSAYPGKTLRDYLTDVGFDMESVPSGAIFVTGEEEVYHASGYWDGGGIGIKQYCRFNAISIDDANIGSANHEAYIFGARSNNSTYHESTSKETVLSFAAA